MKTPKIERNKLAHRIINADADINGTNIMYWVNMDRWKKYEPPKYVRQAKEIVQVMSEVLREETSS